MLYIGIDLGTSGLKMLAMEEDGHIVKTVRREYPLSFPHPGWSEQDPAGWYRETISGLTELAAGIDARSVMGISFGGQMHGLVMLDENDNVIRPAILWNDGRTGEEVRYLNEEIGTDFLTSHTGNIAFAGFTAPKILWVRRHEPENFAKIRKIMLPKDYLAYCLSGTFSTDVSDASGMLLLDVQHRTWSDEMLKICGISREQLPHLYESYEPVGTLKPEIARQTGLSQSVIVAAGAGDNAAAAVGTGTVGDGRCNISLGTSGTIFLPSSHYGYDRTGRIHSFCDANGQYHLMGCMLSAASCNQWWMDPVLGTTAYEKEQEGIEANLGQNRVFFLPYLMGERSPWNDPAARGGFIGLSLDTARRDMTQAVLEGVCFGVRDMYEVASEAGVKPRRSMICGGGARSPLWRRIMANVLNIDIDVPSCEEGPSMGGAMLAMVSCGAYASPQEAAEAIVKVSATVHPDPDTVSRYEERYQVFRTLYPALKDIFPRLRVDE